MTLSVRLLFTRTVSRRLLHDFLFKFSGVIIEFQQISPRKLEVRLG